MSTEKTIRRFRTRLLRLALLFVGTLVVGTVGYRLLVGEAAPWLDCLYMVVITITTIGYGEVVPIEHNPAARVFTMVLALTGAAIITFVFGTVTTAAVDGEFKRAWRRWKMRRAIRDMSGHYIVCGWSVLAPPLLRELIETHRDCVLVGTSRARLAEELGDQADGVALVEGDPTDDDILREAGIERAGGLIAADDEDNTNIVICMTARTLNPGARIVAGVRDEKSIAKIRKAGASAVVSPIRIGALRMASEMVRPSVVSFLDRMLRDREKNLRVEDVAIGPGTAGKTVAELGLDGYPATVLLALRRGDDWTYKPAPASALSAGDILVVMTNPDERQRLEQALK